MRANVRMLWSIICFCNFPSVLAKIGTLICLSAIFGPILIRKQPLSESRAAAPDAQNMKEITKLTEIMIEQVEELFGFFKFSAETKFEDIYEVFSLSLEAFLLMFSS